eukprot:TRINITY_DN47406_c0_g1_i2.p1 TRINITY_DN47406_c0_g1~~TRINITY_DN47406_c0_g1_i2.p1  ORF type:complete len:355 (+),score=43.94 TRINITY_DN47406_c0_g1_i2:235-1299(+)
MAFGGGLLGLTGGAPMRIFVYDVPRCAGEALLDSILDGGSLLQRPSHRRQHSGPHVPPEQQANALYLTKIARQVRPLHRQLVAGRPSQQRRRRGVRQSKLFDLTDDPEEAQLFYVPAFFSLLLWDGSEDAIRCIASVFQALRRTAHFGIRRAAEHFVIHGAEYGHYRDSSGFRLEDYDEVAALWIVLTVACPAPCGRLPDSKVLRRNFVIVPHASSLDCRRQGNWQELSERPFLVGLVATLATSGAARSADASPQDSRGGQSNQYPEREAFFLATCTTQRHLQLETGEWHESAPWTPRHWVLDGDTTLLDGYLLSEEMHRRRCLEGRATERLSAQLSGDGQSGIASTITHCAPP